MAQVLAWTPLNLPTFKIFSFLVVINTGFILFYWPPPLKIFLPTPLHIAHLRNQFNHVFALLISLPRFTIINFYQNSPKINIFLQNIQNF